MTPFATTSTILEHGVSTKPNPQVQVSGTCQNVANESAVCTDTSSLSAIMLAQQLPPLPKFSGEDLDNEPFEDWIVQFDMIAGLCKWGPPAKLVHFLTRLRGQAFAFYKSCAPSQKSDYNLLVTEFRKRFTPVRIQAV